MGLLSNIIGTLSSVFNVGGKAGFKIKSSSAVAEIKNYADDAYQTLRAANLTNGAGLNDVSTKLDLLGIVPNIEFAFTGASAPPAGSNTNKFGLCHTTGGSYTAADIVFDNGTSLVKIYNVTSINSMVAVSGTINLIQNGHYSKSGSTFTLTGDGSGSSTGVVQCLTLDYVYTDTTKNSTTVIPSGATVVRVENVVSTPFNGTSPTLTVAVQGSTPVTVLGTTESDLSVSNQYESLLTYTIGASNTGAVRATISSGSSTAGAGKVYVFYVTALA